MESKKRGVRKTTKKQARVQDLEERCGYQNLKHGDTGKHDVHSESL